MINKMFINPIKKNSRNSPIKLKRRYSLNYLRKLPTISHSQADDLKIEGKNFRVWLSRMKILDGMPYNNQVTVEKYDFSKGRWITVYVYQAK